MTALLKSIDQCDCYIIILYGAPRWSVYIYNSLLLKNFSVAAIHCQFGNHKKSLFLDEQRLGVTSNDPVTIYAPITTHSNNNNTLYRR